MRKIAVLFAVQLLAFFSARAQFQLPESRDLAMIKSKVLLVPVQEEVTRTLMDLQSKPDALQAYKDGIARFNQQLKEAVDQYWTLGKGVEYMPRTKVEQLMKEGNSKYIALQYELREGNIDQLMFSQIYGSENYNNDTRKLSKSKGYGVFRLMQPAARGQGPAALYSVFLPVAYPSQGDMVYAVKMMNAQLTKAMKEKTYTDVAEFEAAVAKNNKSLANKTLLIDPLQIESRTTIDDLRKNYAYPIEMADYDKINQAIISGDTTYAFVMIVPDADPGHQVNRSGISTRIMHLVVDPGSEEVLATCKPSRLDYQKVAEDISKKEIKDYVIKK